MNPILVADIGFSFFSNLFSSGDKDEEKPKKEEKQKKTHSLEKRKINKSLENANTEENSNNSKKKEEIEAKKEEKKAKKKKKEENGIIKEEKSIITEEKEILKEENNIIKEEDIKEKEVNNIIKTVKDDKKESSEKTKNSKTKKTKDELINYLTKYIKNVYMFKKKAKSLIQKHKDNFAITTSVNKNNLSMNIIINDEIKKVKYTYEPLLDQNIFYLPRKLFRKKNLVKFTFVNKDNESIIDPKFNTEYDCGEFINVINLKKIKDKEEEREEEFQTFLESYYTIKPGNTKQNMEANKISLEVVRVKKKHRTMDGQKRGLLFGMSKSKNNSSSILRQRPIKRVASNKKITFSDKNETLSYKKDD